MLIAALITSEALTLPSWKEQLLGSWVHRLRYLHQWQRKVLFTQDRHLQGQRNALLPGMHNLNNSSWILSWLGFLFKMYFPLITHIFLPWVKMIEKRRRVED